MEEDTTKKAERYNKEAEEQQKDADEEKSMQEESIEEEPKEEKSKKEKKDPRKHKKQSKQEKKIQELEEKYKDINEKYLRLYSEFDNYRRRTIKERIEYVQNASKDLIVELLPILDDFERAIKSVDQNTSDNIDTFKEGLQLIYNKFKAILKAKGLEEIKAEGEEFDTDFHEAVTQIKADEKDKGKVIDVIEKGYLLNDKVIRYAKVVVGQ